MSANLVALEIKLLVFEFQKNIRYGKIFGMVFEYSDSTANADIYGYFFRLRKISFVLLYI
jgi:hypothetical protein